jgi:hypothetical protein
MFWSSFFTCRGVRFMGAAITDVWLMGKNNRSSHFSIDKFTLYIFRSSRKAPGRSLSVVCPVESMRSSDAGAHCIQRSWDQGRPVHLDNTLLIFVFCLNYWNFSSDYPSHTIYLIAHNCMMSHRHQTITICTWPVVALCILPSQSP